MRVRFLMVLLTLAALFSALPANAAAETPADTTFYFVNIGAGRDIYELDGHSAIAVVYPDGRGEAYNYGVFDFDAPNFVWRFVKGETDYMSVAVPLQLFLMSYAGTGRSVELARLALSQDQKQRLLAVLRHDVDPRYRTYRYNYVLDNCATRPLCAIERAMADSITLGAAPAEAQSEQPLTFRGLMRLHHANYPWYQFGIDLALGSGIDRPISRREMAFAPVELMHMLPQATVGGRPLVDQTFTAQQEVAAVATDGPTPWLLTPMAAALAILALAIVATWRDVKHGHTSPWFDTVFFSLLGVAGLVLTFLIFVSVHEATSPNWLYVWLNPLCFLPVVCEWIKRAKKMLVCYFLLNFAAVTALTLAWPWIPQSANAAFLPLVGADLLRSATFVYINRKH